MPLTGQCPRDATINRIENDMYYSARPLTVRMQTMEDCVDRLEATNKTHEERTDRKFNIILAGIISICGAIIVDLIFKK